MRGVILSQFMPATWAISLPRACGDDPWTNITETTSSTLLCPSERQSLQPEADIAPLPPLTSLSDKDSTILDAINRSQRACA